MPGLRAPASANEITLAEVVNDLLAKLDVLTTKMNTDAGISDTDYDVDFESGLDIEQVDGSAI